MGCTLFAPSGFAVTTSAAARLVLAMTSPGIDRARDCDDALHQCSIANSSVKSAAASIGQSLPDFLIWCDTMGIDVSGLGYDSDDWAKAHRFISDVALTDDDVWVSY